MNRIPVQALALVSVSLLTGLASAQATIRPIPSIARTWEARSAAPAGFAREMGPNAESSDLGFITPLELQRGPREANASLSFAELELYLDSVGASGFEGGGGSLSTQRGGWQVALGRESLDGFSFAIEVGTEATFYDMGGAGIAALGVTDPFNDLYDTHLAGRFQWQTSERMAFYGGVEIGIAGEDAVAVDDSGYLGAAAAIRYEASDDFALLIGIAGVSRFDDSPWILPYIGFDWQVTERLRLVTEGAEIHADYQVSKNWSAGFEAVYDFRQYRLNKNGNLHGGSFRDEEIRVGGSLTWNVRDNIELDFSAGKMLWREVRFHDGVTGYVGENELSKPVYVSFGMKVSF